MSILGAKEVLISGGSTDKIVQGVLFLTSDKELMIDGGVLSM
jgi:hypothetical protein